MMRQSDTHVFFWHGPLSNWHRSATFDGTTAFRNTAKLLDSLTVDRPADMAVSSRLLQAADFGCGEQWMMACKAWMFDRRPTSLSCDPDIDIAGLLHRILSHPRASALAPLGRVLRTAEPREQKAIGRSIPGYVDTTWQAARVACVTAGAIARFTADHAARKVLLDTSDKILVEASPYDRIWGVGLGLDDARILDPRQWRGRNLLGQALMDAREALGT